MNQRSFWIFPLLLLSFFSTTALAASDGGLYPDGRGGTVRLPHGDISFADEVVSFRQGKPAAASGFSRPEFALGPPDYDKFDDDTDTGYVTLGCGGTVILRFTDNALIDIPGPDLFVFEIGNAVEATHLSISVDGNEWIRVGGISGGTAFVDIAKVAAPGEIYRYVRLTDLKSACGNWPGADIDAVAAIGSGLSISLSSEVLFDIGKSELRDEARSVLEDAARRIASHPDARVLVDGHTDAVGSESSNMKLSRRRADAVRAFLESRMGESPIVFQTRAFGEARPAASNETAAGRQINRRVEIIIIVPEKVSQEPPEKKMQP